MTLLKSSLWILAFLFSLPEARGLDENIFPVGQVVGEGWINVRAGDDPRAPIRGHLRKGDLIAVQSSGERYRILDGQFAGSYIAANFVQLTDLKAPLIKSNGDGLSIRAYPSKNGRIIGSVNKGAYFVGELQGEWYKIKSGPYVGRFVSAQFARPIDESGSKATEAKPLVLKDTPEPLPAQEAEPPAAEPVAIAEPAPAEAPPPPSPPASKMKAFLIKSGAPEGKPGKGEAEESKPPEPSSTPPTATSPPPPPPPLVTGSSDEAKEQRFNQQVEKAFKKKKSAAESNELLMPVFNGQEKTPSGQVNSQVIGAKEIQVEANEFFKILRKHVAESWFDKPEVKALLPGTQGNDSPWIAISAFKGTGVDIYYDELKLEVRILVPSEMRTLETTSLGSSIPGMETQNFENQSFLSSYTNIMATETIDSRNEAYKDRRAPMQAQVEHATNIGNFVLEGYGTYTEKRGDVSAERSAFVRQDVRVTRDFPNILSRGSVGDVVYPVESFQVYRPMKGVAFYRQYAMAPSKLTYPTGNQEIFLKNNSKVSIFVNDQLQKVVDLPAGRHQLKDFQYTSGMNDVRFEIVDQYGQTEIVTFSYAASTDLLKPGLQQFSYAAGTPSTSDPVSGQRIYERGKDTFSAFHRYGFSDFFTGGVNGQLDSKQSIFGLEGNFSLRAGYLKLDTAYSQTAGMGSGFAVGSLYNFVDYKGPDKTQRSLNAGLTYRSDLFSEFGTTTEPSVARRLNLTLGHSRGLSKMMALNVGLNYTLNHGLTTTASNGYQLRLGLSNRWTNGLSGNVTVAHSKLSTGKDDIGITAFLIWSFPKEKQTLSAYTNTTDASTRLGWNYNPSSGADSATYQANLREDKREKGYGGSASLNGNHARLAASHEVVLTKYDEPSTTVVESERANNVTTLQWGSSFVYAGGTFGVGRPVTDSFAVIAPRKSLRGQNLKVNADSEDNYIAKSDWLGPAVVPELSSYNPTTLVVSAKNLPLGVSIPQDHFNLYPRYKSGYGFPLGNDANIYLTATLTDPGGAPLSMASGLATNLDDPGAPAITVFTTRRGVLQSEGFKIGRFRVSFYPDKFEPFEVVIPKEAKEEYNLGTVQLKARK